MIKEVNLLGVYLPPMLAYLAVTAVLWLVLRHLLRRLGVYRWVWHRPLFDTALFVILLAGIVVTQVR
jgi:hypothetical protein